jgi:hypothetical protein
MEKKIEMIKARLRLAEDHLFNYTTHMSECDRTEHHIFEEAIIGLRKEVAVLKWTLKVLES